jgi:hypothetical protein
MNDHYAISNGRNSAQFYKSGSGLIGNYDKISLIPKMETINAKREYISKANFLKSNQNLNKRIQQLQIQQRRHHL